MKEYRFLVKMLVLTLLTFMCLPSEAQIQQLVVYQINVTKMYFALDEMPKITFSKDSIFVKTVSFEASYHIDEIEKYIYEEVSVGVGKNVYTEMVIMVDEGSFSVKNLVTDSYIQVVASDGVVLSSQQVKKGNSFIFSLANMPSGVYIVKIGDSNYKILKR